MGKISAEVGDIVWLNFPFSDLKDQKFRPTLVVAKTAYKDLVVCQITTVKRRDKFAVEITAEDFEEDALDEVSYIKVAQLFTANKSMAKKKTGKLNPQTMQKVWQKLSAIFPECSDG